MLQNVDGLDLYIVDFDTMPELPITGEGEERPYAEALTAAIVNGIVTEPGKYGIHFTDDDRINWMIYRIIE